MTDEAPPKLSKKRKLTDVERRHFRALQLAVERQHLVDHDIEVTVYEETDDDGLPRFAVTKRRASPSNPSRRDGEAPADQVTADNDARARQMVAGPGRNGEVDGRNYR